MRFTLLNTIILILCMNLGYAQNLANMEDISIPADSFLNGQDMIAFYQSGNFTFPVSYDSATDAWTGWAISNKVDTTSASFKNQFSSITGGGAGGSSNYAVSFGGQDFTTFASIPNVLKLEEDAIGKPLKGVQITNGTYPYLSIKNGDGFAKKFGGASGNDPDFFLLTIKAYYNGVIVADSVDFYLADYRSADNTQDYIVDEWTFVDLSILGNVDSLIFILNSTDAGAFGMNTPGYFCLDNLESAVASSTLGSLDQRQLSVYPNPSHDIIKISLEGSKNLEVDIFDLKGQLILHKGNVNSSAVLDIGNLNHGLYLIQVKDGQEIQSKLFQKN